MAIVCYTGRMGAGMSYGALNGFMGVPNGFKLLHRSNGITAFGTSPHGLAALSTEK
jgi:hypothetical protein